MKAIIPLGKRVVVRRDASAAESVTRNGIVIPNPSPVYRGEVIAVGPDVEAGTVFTGDIVVYSQYGGTEFELTGGPVLVLSIEDIIGKAVV